MAPRAAKGGEGDDGGANMGASDYIKFREDNYLMVGFAEPRLVWHPCVDWGGGLTILPVIPQATEDPVDVFKLQVARSRSELSQTLSPSSVFERWCLLTKMTMRALKRDTWIGNRSAGGLMRYHDRTSVWRAYRQGGKRMQGLPSDKERSPLL